MIEAIASILLFVAGGFTAFWFVANRKSEKPKQDNHNKASHEYKDNLPKVKRKSSEFSSNPFWDLLNKHDDPRR